MKQVNLMEQLTKIKLVENNCKKNVNEINDKTKNIIKTEICNTYLIPLLAEYFIDKIPIFSDILKIINDKETSLKEYDIHNFYDDDDDLNPLTMLNNMTNTQIIQNIVNSEKRHKFIKIEKSTTFFYQTCLNFVNDYSDLILTQKFSEQTKKELIINAFIYSDFGCNLLKTYQDFEDFEDGCHISIDLHEISKDF